MSPKMILGPLRIAEPGRNRERTISEYRYVGASTNNVDVVNVRVRDDLTVDLLVDGRVLGIEKVGQLMHMHDLLDVLAALKVEVPDVPTRAALL